MRRIHFARSVLIVFTLFVGWTTRCAGSDQERLVVRDGKKLICTVWFATSMSGDCGSDSYDAVFTAKILMATQVHGSANQHAAKTLGAMPGSDLRLTVEPEEIFKGHPSREVQIFAEQGECFAEVRVGDEWLFFAGRNSKTGGLEISYHSSNPSGPVERRNDYVARLRRLARGDGRSFIAGEVDFPFNDFSKLNHRLRITSQDEQQRYSVATDAEGRFEVGPVAPGVYRIDGDTDPQFRNVWDGLDSTATQANGCSFIRLQLEVNSEISGRVILPEGYEYKKSEVGNLFPLFAVEVDTPDGKQVRGTTIGDPLMFAVRGLAPGTYIVQLVNWQGESWLKMPVYAPGVTDTASALRIDLGLAEHRTGLEIRVPPEALKRRTEHSKN
jgi:hypothetical protein